MYMLDAQTYPINMIHIFFKILIINTDIGIQRKEIKLANKSASVSRHLHIYCVLLTTDV